MTRRILFVAMQQSTHAARWVSQIADQGWDLHLFPVNYLPVIPELRGITVHQPWFRVRPRKLLRKLVEDSVRFTRGRRPIDPDDAPGGVRTRAILPLPVIGPLERLLCFCKAPFLQ